LSVVDGGLFQISHLIDTLLMGSIQNLTDERRDFSRLNNSNMFVFANICDFGKLFMVNHKIMYLWLCLTN